MNEIILKADNLIKKFPIQVQGENKELIALNSLSFKLHKKETLAVVGESGCGKSTLAKVLMGIHQIDGGEVTMLDKVWKQGESVTQSTKMQMIFQDPYNSLNPRKKAWEIIAAPLLVRKNPKESAKKQAIELMEKVGLRADQAEKFPHMFSGGQRQRIGIARALILRPEIIICDEPVSALDVSIQAQVINLLMDLQNEFDLSYIFISHDLSVVRHISDKLLVMYLGQEMESGPCDEIFHHPSHPYTQLLLKSVPSLNQRTEAPNEIEFAELPSPMNRPQGCPFQSRCEKKVSECLESIPPLKSESSGVRKSCFVN